MRAERTPERGLSARTLAYRSSIPTATRWMHDLLCVLGYLGYFSGHLVFSIIVVPAYLVLSLTGSFKSRFIAAVFTMYVTFLTRWYLPGLSVYRITEISGIPEEGLPHPAIYVANHRSRIDGPVLLGLTRPSGAVIKADYARNMLYSGFVKHCNFVSVDPSSLSSLPASIIRAGEVINKGYSLLVFPEGTRSPSGRLLPFKDVAFRIALAMNLPVIPVVLHTDHPFMAKCKGSILPPLTMQMTIRFLKPTHVLENERPSECAARVERQIAAHLHELDKGTVWAV